MWEGAEIWNLHMEVTELCHWPAKPPQNLSIQLFKSSLPELLKVLTIRNEFKCEIFNIFFDHKVRTSRKCHQGLLLTLKSTWFAGTCWFLLSLPPADGRCHGNDDFKYPCSSAALWVALTQLAGCIAHLGRKNTWQLLSSLSFCHHCYPDILLCIPQN